MKRLASILLCIAMLCSLVVVTAYADDPLTADFADVTIPAGGSGTVEMNLDNNTGLASLKFAITNEIGATYGFEKNEDVSLGATANNAKGSYYFVGAENTEEVTFGILTIIIPASVEPGDYTFTVTLSEGFNDAREAVEVAGTTFTVTVIQPEITEVNVMIDSGVNIGVYTNAATTLVALNVAKSEYALFEAGDFEQTEDGYVCFINVNPWSMDEDYIIDFASNFTFAGETLDMKALTEEQKANAIGILSYAKQVMGTDDALDQLLADLLEFGRQAQIYNGQETPSYELPDGLTATDLIGGADFAADCADNYGAERNESQNATAAGKFKFVSAKIEFGSRFVVTFTVDRPSGSTAWSKAKVQIDGVWNSLEDDQTFTYVFSPAEFEGVEFYLWTNGTTKGSKNANLGWINTYGPVNYAAYLANAGEDAEALLAVLEAYCNYGASVAAYKG